jgi:hypothetical protein
LQHFDGTNGSTTIPADDIAGVSWTNDVGNLTLSSSRVQFGATGCSAPSFPAQSATATGFTTNPSDDLTIEGWFIIETNHAPDMTLQNSGSQVAGLGMLLNQVRFVVRDSGFAIIYDSGFVAVTNSLSTFYHYAGVIEGGVASVYCNGVRAATGSLTGTINTGNMLFISTSAAGAGTGCAFDEVRVSKFARYSGASFTVPTSPFTAD